MYIVLSLVSTHVVGASSVIFLFFKHIFIKQFLYCRRPVRWLTISARVGCNVVPCKARRRRTPIPRPTDCRSPTVVPRCARIPFGARNCNHDAGRAPARQRDARKPWRAPARSPLCVWGRGRHSRRTT